MDWGVMFIFLLTVGLVLFLAVKKPYFKLGKMEIETYAIAALVGPILLFASGHLFELDWGFFWNGDVSPLKILILFLSMVFVSIFLDHIGVLEWAARQALRWSGNSGKKLFLSLYAVVSILTIFTSNDIIILTLTPFVYYFTKHAQINPVPFLLMEFFAANSWSTFLPIGNPTNIYILSSVNIPYMEYVYTMFWPTLIGGVANLVLLYAFFHADINQKIRIQKVNPNAVIADRSGAIWGVMVLLASIILLSFTDSIGIPMWKIALASALMLAATLILRTLFTRRPHNLVPVLHRTPWSVIPFSLSFFILVYALERVGYMAWGALMLTGVGGNLSSVIFSYGFTSAIFSNFLNNIPMSVAFSSVLHHVHPALQNGAAYATIIGSNIGAYFTPFGALAGIMWMSILRHKRVNLSYGKFIQYGCLLGILVLLANLVPLVFILNP